MLALHALLLWRPLIWRVDLKSSTIHASDLEQRSGCDKNLFLVNVAMSIRSSVLRLADKTEDRVYGLGVFSFGVAPSTLPRRKQ